MNEEIRKLIELTRLRANMFEPELSPAQIKYNNDMADWIEEQNFQTVEEATAAIAKTEFYTGGGDAKMIDDINMRINAMKDVGYDDVAAIHEERLSKLTERGYMGYCFSRDWLEDLTRVQDAKNAYAMRKETFGKIFNGYVNLISNPQEKLRKEAAEDINSGLTELKRLGTSFDELAGLRAYKQLTLLTDKGFENFVRFIHSLMDEGFAKSIKKGKISEFTQMNEITDERRRVEKWAKKHAKELVEAGKAETWKRANCVAVPSDDSCGYDFISLKEVSDK